MPRRRVHVDPRAADATLCAGFAAARAEFQVPEQFPPDVLQAADEATSGVRLPDLDRTDIPFRTLDPPGSKDLDQALHVERTGHGYRVFYAIADVAAFVAPGGAIDREAHRRVETVYTPDRRIPLHPTVLSEGAASLLPGERRPALLWEVELDDAGRQTSASVRRAVVRSQEQHAYDDVQAALDAGSAAEWVLLLREIGSLREKQESARGGVSLPVPEQEVVPVDGSYGVVLRRQVPVERWNAQISLLTGMAAAEIALDGGVGILRTMPGASPPALERLRKVATGLGVDWPGSESYPDFVRRLDPAEPRQAAVLQEATSVMRGAGYTVLTAGSTTPTDRENTPDDGEASAPRSLIHGAIAAPYCHVTAPLRRLVDRYAGEACLALCEGRPVASWVTDGLPQLPREMADGDRRAGAAERACVDLVEAAVLQDRVGETFSATAVDVSNGGGVVQLIEPAVRGRYEGAGLPLGERVTVRLTKASVADRTVLFGPA